MHHGLHSLYQNRHNDFYCYCEGYKWYSPTISGGEPHEMLYLLLVMYSLWKLDTPLRTYIAFPSYVLQWSAPWSNHGLGMGCMRPLSVGSKSRLDKPYILEPLFLERKFYMWCHQPSSSVPTSLINYFRSKHLLPTHF